MIHWNKGIVNIDEMLSSLFAVLILSESRMACLAHITWMSCKYTMNHLCCRCPWSACNFKQSAVKLPFKSSPSLGQEAMCIYIRVYARLNHIRLYHREGSGHQAGRRSAHAPPI